MAMATATAINDEEQSPLSDSATPLDERILTVVRNAQKNNETGQRTIRPALLAAELGLSVEEATRELCGLLSAVGGGEDGASFVFERVEMPTGKDGEDSMTAAANAATTTMVFTFPDDFDKRAQRFRRRSDLRQRLRSLSAAVVKAVKIFTAFGLIISLAVLIIAAICLLVAAVIALARGGQGGNGGHRNHPLMHRLRYLFFQLRQLLWLYAICGSAIDSNQDPFMREVAGDLAFMMSMFCGNGMHPFFWFRVRGMRSRWRRVRRMRGWGNAAYENMDGIAMMRRGTWEEDDSSGNSSLRNNRRSASFSQSSDQQRRGLLSIAVEFLFGPDDSSVANNSNLLLPPKELEKWKFRASVIMALSSASQGNGVSLRDLLPYVDNPPASADDPSAIRETLRIVTYFNGRPIDCSGKDTANNSGMNARFCFPEIVAEMDCQKLITTMGSSDFVPPPSNNSDNFSSILYKEDDEYNNFGSSSNASSDMPEYLYERPFVLTELSRQQFGQCLMLGLLNFVGIIWVRNAMMPGGLLELRVTAAKTKSRSRKSSSLMSIAAFLVLKLLTVLRFYAGFFFLLPLCRLVIILVRNYGVGKRNDRRLKFVRAEL